MIVIKACRLALKRLLPRQHGQVAVEYVLVTALIAVAMAGALDVLFGALESYYIDLSHHIAKPYP